MAAESHYRQRLAAIANRHESNVSHGPKYGLPREDRQEQLALRQAWQQSGQALTKAWRQVLCTAPHAPCYYRCLQNPEQLRPGDRLAWLEADGQSLCHGEILTPLSSSAGLTLQPLANTGMETEAESGLELPAIVSVLVTTQRLWLEVLDNPRWVLNQRMTPAIEAQRLYQKYLGS